MPPLVSNPRIRVLERRVELLRQEKGSQERVANFRDIDALGY